MRKCPNPKLSLASLVGGMKIRSAGYVPASRGKSVITQVCRNCGEHIPVDEIEYMRIELLDPRYKEQKAVAEKRQMATNLGGADVARNVKRLAERREDDSNVKRPRSYMNR
jgi:splicing factor 3A subunit 1